MAGDCQALLAIISIMLERPGLAADTVLARALWGFAWKLVLAVDGNKRGFGLTGASPNKVSAIKGRTDREGVRVLFINLVID